MPSRDYILRLNRTQVLQMDRILRLAEGEAAKGNPALAFVAQHETPERVDFIDLQLNVEELYRTAIVTKGQPA